MLRTAKERDGGELLVKTVQSEFRRRGSDVPKNDFDRIEHNIRYDNLLFIFSTLSCMCTSLTPAFSYGYKQIKLMKMPGFSAASVTGR